MKLIEELLARHAAEGIPNVETTDIYNAFVPKSPLLNAVFRRKILALGYESREMADEIRALCSRDCLFFINTFCWLLEARGSAEWQMVSRFGQAKEIPFITREYQDKAIIRSIRNLGKRDIVVPKSRETGVTWLYLSIALWDWAFHEQAHIGLASKDEASVDDPDDPDSLMSKLDFQVQRLPAFLRPRLSRSVTSHTYRNLDNDSTITGYAATSDIGRGGRKKWFFMDEFHFFPAGPDYASLESTQHVTRSRVFVSTMNRRRGQSGAFYDITVGDDRNIEIIDIDWKDDVDKRRGLYHSDRVGDSELFTLVIDDTDFWKLYDCGDGTYRHPTSVGEKYPFITDGNRRSLYYDFEWNRPGATPQSIAAELDKNAAGATAQVCDAAILKRAMESVKPPTYHGEIFRTQDRDRTWSLDITANGALKLWCELTDDLRPQESEYSLGCDISAGTGGAHSSYSAIAIFDKRTGEQVMEWRSNRIDPIEFSDLCAWFGEMFWSAYIVPEINGPLGTIFINALTKAKYRNIYFANRKKTVNKEKTTNPGYFNSDGGVELLEKLQKSIQRKEAKVNSILCLKEMGRYFYKNGSVVHSGEQGDTDDGKGKAHGDLAIATGVAWHGVEDWPAKSAEVPASLVPEGCFLWRRQQFEKTRRQAGQKAYWSPY